MGVGLSSRLDELLLQLCESLRKSVNLVSAEVWTGENGYYEWATGVPHRNPPGLVVGEKERPGDDRYLAARRYQYELLRAEGEDLRRDHAQLTGSLSWRLTAPLRRGKAAVRRAQSRLRRRRAR